MNYWLSLTGSDFHVKRYATGSRHSSVVWGLPGVHWVQCPQEVLFFSSPLLKLDTRLSGSGNVNWENASNRLAHRQVCGSTFFIKMIGESPVHRERCQSWAGSSGSYKKGHWPWASKPCSFMVSASVPALTSFHDGLWCRCTSQINPFLPKFGGEVMLLLIESKLREKNNKISSNQKKKKQSRVFCL